ncbi:MAG: endonuclease I family protein [Phycisphaeraceae bacterium]
MRLAICFVVLSCLFTLGCDPPESASAEVEDQSYTGYYADIDPGAVGDELKAQLHALVDDHIKLNYRELWDALTFTDQDPDNLNNVLLVYTGWSLSADAHGNDASGWNREHVWSKSRGDFGTRQGAGTDLHAIRPAEVSVNTARGNKSFDEGGELYIDRDGPTSCRRDHDSWEPRDEVKGDIARAIFYMAVRYEDAELDLELTEDSAAQQDKAPLHGVASTLLRWHQQDPPDGAERLRNDRVEIIQGNRNPFIDQPQWADELWRSGRE